MANIGDAEIKTQKRVISFFHEQLNYTYIGDLHDSENTNIIEDILRKYLEKAGYSYKLANKALTELIKVSTNLQKGLYNTNKEVYSLLRYGCKISEEPNLPPKTIYFIDFENPENNTFSIAEEVTVKGNNTKRPDLVIYVNGIALAIIELKSSKISVTEGIKQNLTNQKPEFIEKFFTTIQFCMAGNNSEGLRYGTIHTKAKYYLEWKVDCFNNLLEELDKEDRDIDKYSNSIANKLDKQIYLMFNKKRFLCLIHDFIIFDKGEKKLCRYNQYYAIKRAEYRISQKKTGGIIWHTQGSGKSLTMVWLAKWLLSNEPTTRVLIVTDREELDDQIEKLFIGVEQPIVRTKNCKDLITQINTYDNRLVCSLVHKFGRRGGEATEQDYDKYIEELKTSLPSNFSAKGNFVVFVDECHRTQSGKLHIAMRTILPNAIFIGFTGTPLLRKDKKTSIEVFGSYIHTYKFDEAVRDGVILDLRYEYRDVPQDITSQEKIDEWFNKKTNGLSERGKAHLKQLWGNMQKVFSSRSRLAKIAADIKSDFGIKDRLIDGAGNAMLVASNIYEACKYYEIFQEISFKNCAIITSYSPDVGQLRTDTVDEESDTDNYKKYTVYNQMIKDYLKSTGQKADGKITEANIIDFEQEVKRKFVEEPKNMKLLIVVDKLLTGFNAPPCTYLYIDKAMHDHGLFQAICRVNRLDGESKEFGYIVDYKQLFDNLTSAMDIYTSGAFEDYDPEDVTGLLKDRKLEAKKYFEESLDELDSLCEGVEAPCEEIDYIHFFCGESGNKIDDETENLYAKTRDILYKTVNKLIRAYAEVKPYMNDIGYSLEEREKFDKKVCFYINLKQTIGHASGDFIDYKVYEPDMRHLIDNYIEASNAVKIADFGDFTLLDYINSKEDVITGDKPENKKRSVAEDIENNIRKKIVEKITVNPAYYSKMSEILEKLILERKQQVITYKELLEKYKELSNKITNPENDSNYSDSIRNDSLLRTIYDNCGEDEAVTLCVQEAYIKSRQDGFVNNPIKSRRIKKELSQILKTDEEVEFIFSLLVKHEENKW